MEQARIARRILFALLTIQTALLIYSAYVHSPTLNEPGHLIAGLSNWKFGRFELYRVNPPLVRMVAALPVMAVRHEEDWSGFSEGVGARPEFGIGEDFIAANRDRSPFLFMIARWACIPFSWIGALTCYLWARDLFGRPAGIMACALWCFEPNILAHSSLITADAHATALGVAACYTFWRWLKNPTWTQATLTGVVLGLAELAKSTFILFYPIWPLLWVFYRWRGRDRMTSRDWSREAGMLVLRMAIGVYILNLGYGFEGMGQPLKEYRFISNLFSGRDPQQDNDSLNSSPPIQDDDSGNRFADTWLGPLPMPFPSNYLLGVDIQQHDFENPSHQSYLHGKWEDHGWWYYYLYAAAIKVPLAIWVLGIMTLRSQLLWHRRRIRNPLSDCESPASWTPSDIVVLLTPPLVILCVVSSKTSINEHFRYILPCFPFLFIWVSSLAGTYLPIVNQKTFDTLRQPDRINRHAGSVLKSGVANHFLCILILWTSTSSLWIYPHSLSYFNELVGGPVNGPKFLLGSNVDWGQDLFYAIGLDRGVHGDLDVIYFGGYPPQYFFPVPDRGSDGNRHDFAAVEAQSGLGGNGPEQKHEPPASIIVSLNLLYGSRGNIHRYSPPTKRFEEISITDLTSGSNVIARCGYSMVVCTNQHASSQ